jgi:NhaP-type Na+/H+ or K+/H+ antiporter
LVEVLMVLFLGAALTRVSWSIPIVAFALLMVLGVRPLSVMLGVPASALPNTQRRLVAWFGIRGVGSLFFLALALQFGITGPDAQTLLSACLGCLAMSIGLHGISATPLMNWYQRRRAPRELHTPERSG